MFFFYVESSIVASSPLALPCCSLSTSRFTWSCCVSASSWLLFHRIYDVAASYFMLLATSCLHLKLGSPNNFQFVCASTLDPQIIFRVDLPISCSAEIELVIWITIQIPTIPCPTLATPAFRQLQSEDHKLQYEKIICSDIIITCKFKIQAQQ